MEQNVDAESDFLQQQEEEELDRDIQLVSEGQMKSRQNFQFIKTEPLTLRTGSHLKAVLALEAVEKWIQLYDLVHIAHYLSLRFLL